MYTLYTESSSKTHIPAPSFWPHNLCTCQSSLVTSARKDRFQGHHADL